MKVLNRLLVYIFEGYKLRCLGVVLFIIMSALANVIGTIFIKNLIDHYIAPFLGQGQVDFLPLLKAILSMAMIYLLGVFSTFMYSRMMIVVSQGTLKRFRDDMFAHMETLPIAYFDTHPHGEIMSL